MHGGGMAQPQMRGMQLNLNSLKPKAPGMNAGSVYTGPLLPTQAVFRQKPLLPWWIGFLIPLLLLLALPALLLLPKNVAVPELVGKEVFAAEEELTKAKLKLDPNQKEKVDAKAKPRHGDLPDAQEGREGRGGHARSSSRSRSARTPSRCPTRGQDLRGRREAAARGRADARARSTRRRPARLRREVSLPAAKEIVNKGKPVDLFLVPPEKAKKDAAAGRQGGAAAAAAARPAPAARARPTSSSRRSARTTSTPWPRRWPTSSSCPRKVNAFSEARSGRCSPPTRPAAPRSPRARPSTCSSRPASR